MSRLFLIGCVLNLLFSIVMRQWQEALAWFAACMALAGWWMERTQRQV